MFVSSGFSKTTQYRRSFLSFPRPAVDDLSHLDTSLSPLSPLTPSLSQLELDAEALERMDELTLQARKEQEETNREKDRLEVGGGVLRKEQYNLFAMSTTVKQVAVGSVYLLFWLTWSESQF